MRGSHRALCRRSGSNSSTGIDGTIPTRQGSVVRRYPSGACGCDRGEAAIPVNDRRGRGVGPGSVDRCWNRSLKSSPYRPQSTAIFNCVRASSSENPRRRRSRKNPSPRLPSSVLASALQMARTSGARSRAFWAKICFDSKIFAATNVRPSSVTWRSASSTSASPAPGPRPPEGAGHRLRRSVRGPTGAGRRVLRGRPGSRAVRHMPPTLASGSGVSVGDPSPGAATVQMCAGGRVSRPVIRP